jgi:hypothetical protein
MGQVVPLFAATNKAVSRSAPALSSWTGLVPDIDETEIGWNDLACLLTGIEKELVWLDASLALLPAGDLREALTLQALENRKIFLSYLQDVIAAVRKAALIPKRRSRPATDIQAHETI